MNDDRETWFVWKKNEQIDTVLNSAVQIYMYYLKILIKESFTIEK